MRLTKLTHACVRLEDGDRAIAIDPGAFSEVDEALDGAAAVLITHEHVDHVQPDSLRAALAKDSALRVFAPAAVVGLLGDVGDRVTVVEAGTSFEVGGFTVGTYGGQHALIHPLVPMCANVGYVVASGGSSVYHPGDSLVVPDVAVDAVLVPTSGPWMKLAEAADFVSATKAGAAYQVHDALLSDLGAGVTENILNGIAGRYGTTVSHLAVRQSVEV